MRIAFTVLTAFIFLSSCADKSDPGLKPNTINNTVVDTLKGKSPVDVLRLKYSLADALCELKRVAAEPAESDASINVPPVVEENEVYMNLKKWSETDPTLKPAPAKVILKDGAVVLTVDLVLKIEMVSQTMKRNNLVYFMKHSPQVTYEFKGKFEGAAGNALSGTGFANERMNTAVKVAELTSGEGANAKKYEYFLDCGIETKVMKESKNFEEYQAQFEVLDCNAPTASQKKLAADNCKPN